jgi:hypothetical protein
MPLRSHADAQSLSVVENLPDIINPYTETPWELETQMFILDWMDENLDVFGPAAAFIGVGIAIALCFIFGA